MEAVKYIDEESKIQKTPDEAITCKIRAISPS